MKMVWRLVAVLLVVAGCAVAQSGSAKKMTARGTFVVKMAPVEASEFEKRNEFMRMTSTKVWHGDFEGTSEGEMIAGGAAANGAMAYVAMENVTGKLAGKSGTFVFTHAATMMKGDAKSGVMRIEIVPNSGTGELKGITGSLTIIIDAKGNHSWVLEYALP